MAKKAKSRPLCFFKLYCPSPQAWTFTVPCGGGTKRRKLPQSFFVPSTSGCLRGHVNQRHQRQQQYPVLLAPPAAWESVPRLDMGTGTQPLGTALVWDFVCWSHNLCMQHNDPILSSCLPHPSRHMAVLSGGHVSLCSHEQNSNKSLRFSPVGSAILPLAVFLLCWKCVWALWTKKGGAMAYTHACFVIEMRHRLHNMHICLFTWLSMSLRSAKRRPAQTSCT